MTSHHFLGQGLLTETLRSAAEAPDALLDTVRRMVEDAGLGVVGTTRVAFDGGGHTLVWVLAESHLVLHLWEAEGYATVDLHVCDYRQSNRQRAQRLVDRLEGYCFRPGTASWRTMSLDAPSQNGPCPETPHSGSN